MNIFYLDSDPAKAAQYHCDLHCIKMILEYGQMLSTAHRVLDGEKNVTRKNNRAYTYYSHKEYDDIIYKASHVNHPCNIWVRISDKNYKYLYRLFVELSKEYEIRYKKTHLSFKVLNDFLQNTPKNIPYSDLVTEIPQCMPDEFKKESAVQAYRNFYINGKSKTMNLTWKNGDIPSWFCAF
jgi:hypothetical protein